MRTLSAANGWHALIAAVVLSCVCETAIQADTLTTVRGKTMGPVPYQVSVADLPASISQDDLQTLVQTALDSVNQSMSTYLPNSEISRFNQSTSTDWFPVSQQTARVVHRALEISQWSDGAFDITVGPLVDLWNFGPEPATRRLPTEAELQTIKQQVGYQYLEAQLDPPALKKQIGSLALDLSAIAKGFAVDQVAEALVHHGISNFLVEVGGEVRTQGSRSDQNPWLIGIDRPVPGTRRLQQTVELHAGSLATSGDYRNLVEIEGEWFSHTIDPRTGRPVQHNLASVSVLADDCMTADALATAIMVLGNQQGRELAERVGVQLFLVLRTDRGFAEHSSPGFPLQDDGDAQRGSVWPMFMAAAAVFLIALVGMSLGVIFSNRRIQGSCGGLASMQGGGESACASCRAPSKECRERMAAASKTDSNPSPDSVDAGVS